jgi:hypothetical protein
MDAADTLQSVGRRCGHGASGERETSVSDAHVGRVVAEFDRELTRLSVEAGPT